MSKEQSFDKFLYDESVVILHIVMLKYPRGLHMRLLIIEHNQYHILMMVHVIDLNNTAESKKKYCYNIILYEYELQNNYILHRFNSNFIYFTKL